MEIDSLLALANHSKTTSWVGQTTRAIDAGLHFHSLFRLTLAEHSIQVWESFRSRNGLAHHSIQGNASDYPDLFLGIPSIIAWFLASVLDVSWDGFLS